MITPLVFGLPPNPLSPNGVSPNGGSPNRGGPEEEGVRLFKDELKETVLKKDTNRFGDIITNDFYLVSTLCDPRYTSKSNLC